MVGPRAYDWMYRHWAPWDSVGVREELRTFLAEGLVTPRTHPRAVDLGCGSGANVVHLAEQGFDAYGVDFSAVALDQARVRADQAGVGDRATFVLGDLTRPTIPGLPTPCDVVIDFGTLDDLRPAGRRAMADLIANLTRPGSVVLFWCFYAELKELPYISFHGPSRLSPAVRPGEERELFGERFDIRPGPTPAVGVPAASFVMTRLSGA